MNKLQYNFEFQEFLSYFINQLNSECNEDAIVIVEGKKDVYALFSLGFNGRIIEYCNNNNISKLERIAQGYKKLIILFDYDAEGRRLTRKIITSFARTSVIELKYRRNLSIASSGIIKHIEELSNFFPIVI